LPKNQKNQRKPKQNQILIAGMDEVGRGPWAGPIVACAYIERIPVKKVKIADSKVLNEAQREAAFEVLIKSGYFGIGMVEAEEIDRYGLGKANKMAFKRALLNLEIRPDLLLVDGRDKLNRNHTNNIPYKSIIKGDSLIREISCASIIAKVTRDRIMKDYSKTYPEYAFENHKGYGTAEHLKALQQHGPCAIHRKSYQPVQTQIRKQRALSRAARV
jgi:ribonuclease HII